MIGYHCVNEPDYDAVLVEGLLRSKSDDCCTEKHFSIAETPEIAASMVRKGDCLRLIEVRLDGLERVSRFVGGEARVHNDIGPERITPFARPVVASKDGWLNPAHSHNHPACLGDPRTREHDITP